MSEYMFGPGKGHLPEAEVDALLEDVGAWVVNYTEPRGERRHWFACRNLGHPFDRDTERAAMALLREAGYIDSEEEA